MSDLDSILDAFADRVAGKLAPKVAAMLPNTEGDPLLTAREGAKRLRMSPDKFRKLVNAGTLKRAEGFEEIRVRQSIVDAYGK